MIPTRLSGAPLRQNHPKPRFARRFVQITLAFSLSAFASFSPLSAGTWGSVPLGGGGYVTGLVSNADGSSIYCRTDVGGAFRWAPAPDGVNGSWVSLSDTMVPYGTASAPGLMNVEGIGTDPNNLNQLYVGAGSNYSGGLKGIFSSSDKGATWTQIQSTIRMSGNGGAKGSGERLAVDPNNSNILWYGSNQDGLYKGVKSGSTWTWTQIPSTTLPFGLAGSGVTFVACDKNTSSTILYAGVRDTTVGGVYKSTDGGVTWNKVSGTSMLTPSRPRVAQNGTLYITAGTGGVAKLTRAGVFTMITTLPAGNYNAIAIDPNNATGDVVYVANTSAGIWKSADGGASWLAQGSNYNNAAKARTEPDGTPSLVGYWFGSTACMLINPADSNQLWLGDFFGVYRTANATAMGTSPGPWWYTLQKNLEETVVLDLKVPTSGAKLLSGVADVGGYRYNDTTVRPSGAGGNAFNNLRGGNTTSLDFSEADNNVWARTWVNSSGSTGSAGFSSDGGVSWLKAGQIALKTVTNSSTGGWETWDIGTYLAKQKAKGVNTVTLVVAIDGADAIYTNTVNFDSKEATDPTLAPKLVVNGSTNLVTTADAVVLGAAPTQNYGNSQVLWCQYYYGQVNNSRWVYLKFDLSSVASITSATLNLHRLTSANTLSFNTGIYACTNTTWVEGDGGTDNTPANELTWNNKPACLSNPGGGPQEGPNYYEGSTAMAGGRIAVSATDPNAMVWVPINGVPRYSNDRGVTWTVSTGTPTSQISGIYTNGTTVGITGRPLASDRVNGNFYIARFGGTTVPIYRSTDGGATWTQVSNPSNGGSYNGRTPQLMAAPAAGDLWLCDDGTYNGSGGGLWRSTDSGGSWTGISTIGKVTSVSFGKAASGTGYVVYAIGIKAGVSSIYQSDDYGATWTALGSPTIETEPFLAGDRQNYGQVYLGTSGRGTFLYSSGGVIDGAVYEIEPVNAPGKRLDVAGGGSANGTNVQIYTDNNTNSQRWTFQQQGIGTGLYELIPSNAPSARLDVASGLTASGTNVAIWADNNSAAQLWMAEKQADGTYELIPTNAPALNLNVSAAGTANGTNVNVETDNNSTAQRWNLIKQ